MGYWDRTKPKTRIVLPERLARLDREIVVERTKDFDYVFAVGNGVRIRVCVMRDIDNKCWATAQLGRQAYRYGGGYSASGAFLMLSVALRMAFARMPQAEKQLIRIM